MSRGRGAFDAFAGDGEGVRGGGGEEDVLRGLLGDKGDEGGDLAPGAFERELCGSEGRSQRGCRAVRVGVARDGAAEDVDSCGAGIDHLLGAGVVGVDDGGGAGGEG